MAAARGFGAEVGEVLADGFEWCWGCWRVVQAAACDLDFQCLKR
jgi:hypothetical protein